MVSDYTYLVRNVADITATRIVSEAGERGSIWEWEGSIPYALINKPVLEETHSLQHLYGSRGIGGVWSIGGLEILIIDYFLAQDTFLVVQNNRWGRWRYWKRRTQKFFKR